MLSALKRLLIAEDVEVDAEMMLYDLRRAGFTGQHLCVYDKARFIEALQTYAPDMILSDFSMPGFDGLTALNLRQQFCPDVPFIVVSGSLGEERAVEIVKAGATDYVLKHNLPRLPAVVSRALADFHSLRERQRIRQELETERRLLAAVLETSAALIALLDVDGRVLRINPAAETACGIQTALANGQFYWDLFVLPDEAEIVRAAFCRIMAQRKEQTGTRPPWRASNRFGRVILWSISFLPEPGARGEVAVLAGLDVTDQEAAKERAYLLSYYDSLTRLPNLALFRDRLRQMQLRANTRSHDVVLVLVGVERVRQVRDSLGADISDVLLVETAQRLRGPVQPDEVLARIGDDCFAITFEIDAGTDPNHRIQDIHALTRTPYQVDQRPLFLPAHIGVAIYPNDGEDVTTMLQAAEAALHRAVESDDSPIEFYAPALFDRARERLLLESELRAALTAPDGGLVLYYQPQVDLASGSIIGAEALIRWQHPRHGELSPGQFIPLAEECDLIVSLGDWVIREVCRQGREWDELGMTGLRYAVNLSARQFAHPDIVELVTGAIQQSCFDVRRLELELTESASMRDPETSIEVMHRLRDLGVRLAIDDFGTGYSNLNYLKRFPVHSLKLDRAFVQDITSDPDDLAISRIVLSIAHQLRMHVVAEGVETEGQLALLAESRCDLIQGFLVSRGLPAEQFAAMVRSGYRLAIPGRRTTQRTLLCVDDEPNILSAMRRLFRESGCRVLIANSPREAFEILATNVVGVILSDHRMPDMTGIEFLNRVKDLYPNVVRMVLSGYADLQTVTEAINRGAVYKFLTKPWDDEKLLAVVAEAFDKYDDDCERSAQRAR